MAKGKKIKKKGKGGKGGRSSIGNSMLGVFGLISGAVFMPSAVILCIGMLPTVAAGLSDRIRGETRALTVGAMNLAGCTPFLLQLWSTEHKLDNAFAIITDPRTIIVIYSAAGVGWIIDWAMAGIVATIMQQRGAARLQAIKERQEALVARWGPEVTGDLPLDAYGFPAEESDNKPAKAGG